MDKQQPYNCSVFLCSQISKYKASVEAVKKFIVEAATADGKRLVFTTEQHPLKYLLFIYYRGFFLVNLKTVLRSKDGMNEEKTLKPEKEFIKKVEEKTDVDNTPPEKNPSERKLEFYLLENAKSSLKHRASSEPEKHCVLPAKTLVDKAASLP